MKNTALGDTGEVKTLHLVVRDPNGRIEYQAIGHAIVAADIDGTELWDREALDLVAPAMLSRKPKGVGQIAFIAIEAQLDYRVVMRDGLPGIEFSFQGFDEGDEVMGRGWAMLQKEQLQGRLFFHQGDDSSFVAQQEQHRNSPANTYRPSPCQERRSSPSGRRRKPKRRKSKRDR